MLSHSERQVLARDLCAHARVAYPGAVRLGGVFGSVARGTDTSWSDLDLLLVTGDDCPLRTRHLVVRGCAVGIQVLSEEEMLRILTAPEREWPYWMGVLSALEVLGGDPNLQASWLEQGRAAPAEGFRRLLVGLLPELVVESYGRIHSCRARRTSHDIGCAVIEVLFEMRQVLCLLNQRWVQHDYYQGLEDTFAFPLLPEWYQELVPLLWRAREIEEIVQPAERLMAAYWRLLAKEGFALPNHQSLDTLEW